MSRTKEAFQDVFDLWDKLVEYNYFTPEELELITNLNGTSTKTLNDAIFARYGYRSWEQMNEEDN